MAVPDARPPPQIWLGDAVRVCAALAVEEQTVERVLEMLGLREEAEGAADLDVATVAPVFQPLRPRLAPAEPSRHRQRPQPTARDVVAPRRGLDAEREPTGAPLPPAVEVTRGDRRPPRPLPSLADVLLPPPEGVILEPADLLDPARQRAVLTPLCSGPAPTGQPDVEALVERLARRQPLVTIPREVTVTTRRGVQLLLDHGPAMLPFWRDQQTMEGTLRRIAGPDGFEVLHFAGTPLDPPGAGTGPQWTWSSYRPPLSAIPVLVLTDLGSAPSGPETPDRREVVDRWLRFATLVRSAGCPLVALVPAPVSRIPQAVRRVIAVVSWDRPTGVRDTVAAARRASGRVPGRPA